MGNALYYGDNLHYLREMGTETVDLVYLDPPFNSKSTYNLLFHTPQGDAVQAQTAAFRDTWWWDTPAEEAFDDVIASGSQAAGILRALRSFLDQSDMMAYLAMMAARLYELQRVLKPTGSLYLHCDPTASHYLKLLLDAIFGLQNFRNEIVWQRTTGKSLMSTRLPTNHDIIFSYQKSDGATWNEDAVFQPYNENNLDEKTASKYRQRDTDGRLYQLDNLINPNPNRPNLTYEFLGVTRVWRWTKDRMQESYDKGLVVQTAPGRVPRLKRYLDEQRGRPIGDVWTDITPINSQARERLGYPTQKPLALLKRIIKLSTSSGDIVLDPFCGCGTTIEAAESLGRRWVGIDVTHHAINIIEERLQAKHPDSQYQVRGRPEDLAAAEDLAQRDKYEFQWWANWLLGVQNYLERKKGADRGIDGIIYFRNGPWGIGQVIVSVKGGQNIGPDMIASLAGTVQREEAQLGTFVCLAEPTRRMRQDAAAAGFEQTAQGRFQKIQIATIAELLEGRRPPLPAPIETDAFRHPLRRARSQKVEQPDAQLTLALPIIGGRKRRRPGVEEHLSGEVLASISGG